MAEHEELGAIEVKRRPRIFLNGFPKAGLHMALLLARSIEPEPAIERGWAGNFADHSWSTTFLPMPNIMAGLRMLRDGSYLKGHMGYMSTVEQYLYWHGAAVAFIYRDLRDVLVSQSYHVIDPNDTKFMHPAKEIYRALNKEERLLACLGGIDIYSGLIERWEMYAPWLHVPWVFQLRYEDMVHKPEETARAFLHYVWERTGWGLDQPEIPVEVEEQSVATMVKNLRHTEYSNTFRKGGTGGWREEFTPRVKDVFKEKAGEWLIRLGYEKDNDW